MSSPWGDSEGDEGSPLSSIEVELHPEDDDTKVEDVDDPEDKDNLSSTLKRQVCILFPAFYVICIAKKYLP
jgi:hypothetical protein